MARKRKLPKHLGILVDTPEKRLRAEMIMQEGRSVALLQGRGPIRKRRR